MARVTSDRRDGRSIAQHSLRHKWRRTSRRADPVRVVAFNCAEHWAEDASEDIAREIMRRLHLAGDELPSSLEAFVERYLGPDRQLTLRLA
jgi:hypothetical protein